MMGAVVVADPGDGIRAGGKRRFAVPALLVLGWAGLFAYSAAYLTEDLPFRPQPGDRPPATEAARPGHAGRRFVMLDTRDDTAREAPRQEAPQGGQSPATPGLQAALVAPPVTRPPNPAVTGAEYVGIWGPTADACAAPSRRRGYIPATITQDRARAGRTLCSFRDSHRVGNAWIMGAECSDRGRHWSSQVRLLVEGDRLTWSSSRGTTTYIRCNRRAG